MTHPKLDFDYCSCEKPADWWGESGWHFRMAGRLECFRRYPDSDEASACSLGLSRDGCKERGGCRYAGVPIAMERCPRWVAALRKRAAEKKRDETSKIAEDIFA